MDPITKKALLHPSPKAVAHIGKDWATVIERHLEETAFLPDGRGQMLIGFNEEDQLGIRGKGRKGYMLNIPKALQTYVEGRLQDLDLVPPALHPYQWRQERGAGRSRLNAMGLLDAEQGEVWVRRIARATGIDEMKIENKLYEYDDLVQGALLDVDVGSNTESRIKMTFTEKGSSACFSGIVALPHEDGPGTLSSVIAIVRDKELHVDVARASVKMGPRCGWVLDKHNERTDEHMQNLNKLEAIMAEKQEIEPLLAFEAETPEEDMEYSYA